VAARLSHPGVVTVHDVIEAGDSPWIIMELVPSRSLAQVLAEDGPLTPVRAAAMGMTLLDALGCAHAAGVVHRDVKPGNILMTSGGRVVLTDFGIATLHGDPRLTQAGMVMGTPGFCAPERIRGEPASPASDLWSLGATLYAAVEGRGPFEGQGSAMAVLSKIVHADPPPASSAGPLAPVIAALMNRDPGARPDAASARRLLAAARSGPGGTGARAGGSPGETGAWGEPRAHGGTLSLPVSVAGVPVTGQQLAVAESAGAGPAPASVPAEPDLPGAGPAGPDSPEPGPAAPDSPGPGPSASASPASVVPLSVPPLFGQAAPGRARAGGAARSRAVAATAASAATSASGEPLASKATQAPGAPKAGDSKRRPGRHRRALLFGGGGAA
jgi:hypothetical protein